MYYRQNEREEGKWRAAVEAALILFFCFSAVVFSGKLDWHSPPPAISVTLVPALRPPAPQPKPKPPPQESKPKKQPVDADVVREQKEKEKRKKEEAEKKKREEEKKRKEEKERKKKEEEEKRKKEEKERKEKELEEEAARKQAEEEARLAAQAAAEQAAFQNRLNRIRGDIIVRTQKRIKSKLKTPTSVPRNDPKIVVVILVRLTPKGELKDLPEVIETSGIPEYDESAVRAVLKAAPLPMPDEPFILNNADFFSGFLEHKLYITPN